MEPLIFGWIGDIIGRKSTVVITTALMALSCITMANLPTYSQIGVGASWIVSICRIIQGMSSMGEITGAQLFLCETIKPPARYPAVAGLNFAIAIGTFASLGVASLVTFGVVNWRLAFWIGALIAIIGAGARTRLRETPEFADAKKRLNITKADLNFNNNSNKSSPIIREKANQKTSIALFLLDCMWPLCFYFVYVHCGNILKNTFHYTSEQVIHQNFFVSIVQVFNCLLFVILSYRVYPLLILKVKLIISFGLFLICPYLLDNIRDPNYLLLLQSAIIFFACDSSPATSIFYRYFPVFKRFTYIGFLYALSPTVTYVITAFGFIYLIDYFGNYGVLIIMMPISIGYFLGLKHFENLEQVNDN